MYQHTFRAGLEPLQGVGAIRCWSLEPNPHYHKIFNPVIKPLTSVGAVRRHATGAILHYHTVSSAGSDLLRSVGAVRRYTIKVCSSNACVCSWSAILSCNEVRFSRLFRECRGRQGRNTLWTFGRALQNQASVGPPTGKKVRCPAKTMIRF